MAATGSILHLHISIQVLYLTSSVYFSIFCLLLYVVNFLCCSSHEPSFEVKTIFRTFF